jgi:thiol-disulfide isomerase/thioredoxin
MLCIAAIAATAVPGLVQDFDGGYHLLEEKIVTGRWTLLALWRSDCHVCNEEIDEIIRFHRDNAEHRAVVLGLALDGLAARFDEQAFIARHGVNFPNLITDESNAAALYEQATGEAWIGTPTFLIFSPDGKLAAKQVGGVTQKLIEDFIAGAKR